MESLANRGCFIVGDYKVDVGDNTISNTTSSTHVEPKAMQVLYVLACHAGETVSREQLMQEVWGGRIVVEDALTRAVSKLRLAFADARVKQLIQTVPKKGYRLKARVEWSTPTLNPELDVVKQDSAQPSDDGREAAQQGNATEAVEVSAGLDGGAATVAKSPPVVLIALGLVLFAFTAFLFYGYKDSTYTAQQETPDSVDIALLPLKNLTGDAEAGYLAEGIPEEISGILSRYSQINVKSRYATYAYARQGLQLNDIARLLSVKYVLEGSVRNSGEQYRIVVRLIDVETEKTVWSSVFEDSTSRLFEVQTEVTNGILQQVLPDQQSDERINAMPQDVDVVAYQYYLTGLYWLMHGKTSEWFYLAEAAFLNAVERDNNFAAAYGRLAYVYARHDYHDVHMEAEIAIPKAQQAIKRAIELDADEINAYLARAILKTKMGFFDEAENALKKALAIQANHPTGLYLFSELELARNNFEQALRYAEEAQDNDPLSPWINVNLAIVQYWHGQFNDALDALATATAVDQQYTWAYVWQSKIQHTQGDLNAAISSMETCLNFDPGSRINSAWLGKLYLQAGEIDKANEWFAHAASLYGDSDDARFWQSYTRFHQQQDNHEVVYQLVKRLSLSDNSLFSLLPMLKQAAHTTQEKQQVVNMLKAQLTVQGQEQIRVNVHNYQSAKVLASMSPVLAPEEQHALQQKIQVLEASLPATLHIQQE